MSAFETIVGLLKQLDTDERAMPATALYNEGWMLRLVLDAGKQGYLPSLIQKGSSWCSEAQLRTPFGRERGAKHESNTRSDGVVGDFTAVADTKSGLEIRAEAQRILFFEAKIYSALSSGTKNAPGYDQAARNVACIAETLRRSGCQALDMSTIAFYVIAPQTQINSGLFSGPMSAKSIRLRVLERIQQFSGIVRDELADWHERWFIPLMSKLEMSESLECRSWEELISEISDSHALAGAEINDFYQKCKQFNRSVSRSSEIAGQPIRGLEYLLTAGKYNGQRVRVASIGPSNSRVYREGSHDESYLIPNSHLQIVAESEQTPPPEDPIVGRCYDWKSETEGLVRVQVIKPGDCNSRVVRLEEDKTSFKVPNHQLFKQER